MDSDCSGNWGAILHRETERPGTVNHGFGLSVVHLRILGVSFIYSLSQLQEITFKLVVSKCRHAQEIIDRK